MGGGGDGWYKAPPRVWRDEKEDKRAGGPRAAIPAAAAVAPLLSADGLEPRVRQRQELLELAHVRALSVFFGCCGCGCGVGGGFNRCQSCQSSPRSVLGDPLLPTCTHTTAVPRCRQMYTSESNRSTIIDAQRHTSIIPCGSCRSRSPRSRPKSFGTCPATTAPVVGIRRRRRGKMRGLGGGHHTSS